MEDKLMYNQNQVLALARELQKRHMKNLVKDYEVVITLMSLEKSELLTTDNVAQILMGVFFDNKQGVLRALERAKPLLSDSLIDTIIAEVSKEKS